MLTERNETLQGGAQQWGELFGAIADDFAMLARLHDREPDTDLLGMLKQQRFPNGLGLRLMLSMRRWRHKNSGESIKRDWNIVMDGGLVTQEFADFLKELD